MRKDQLTKQIEAYLDGYEAQYFITLNTRNFFRRTHRIEDHAINFNRKVRTMMEWLSEYVMGKGRQHLMRAVAFNEIGTDSGMLHTHIIIGLSGETRTPLLKIQNFVDRKWGRFIDEDKDGERPYWVRRKLDKRLQRLKAVIDRTQSTPRYEYELDPITLVQRISDVEKALGYSIKQHMQQMTANQYCSYDFH